MPASQDQDQVKADLEQFHNALSPYLGIIPDPAGYVEHLRRPFPPYFRINTLKSTQRRILQLLSSEGVGYSPVSDVPGVFRAESRIPLGLLKSYHLGYIYPQGLSSALPALALQPNSGHLVLDLCAAPGGKTIHMAHMMGDRGTIVANDRKIGRLTALGANLKRMGITNTILTFYRAGNFPSGEVFDRILVDAPCSGEGKYRLGSNDEILHRVKSRTNLPAIQKGILLRAFDFLRPGGTLVYSTCTINPRENEAVICYLLSRRKADIVPWKPPLAWNPGLTEFLGEKYDQRCVLCRRFYPHRIDSVGFFVAKVVKPF